MQERGHPGIPQQPARGRVASALDRWRFFLTRFANRRGAIVLAGLWALTIGAFRLRRTWVLEGSVLPASGCCPEIPDGRTPPYGPSDLIDAIAQLPGRGIYALSEVTLDVWFPLLYVTLLGAVLVALTRRAERPVTYALLLPLGMAACDVCENLAYAAIAAFSAGIGTATIGSVAAWGKWLFFAATSIAALLLGRRLLARWLGYVMAIRVPLLALFTYLALWRLGNDQGLPTISNMMDAKTAIGLGAASFMTMMTLAVICFAASLAWRHAHRRLGLDEIALPIWILERPVWSVLPFLALGLPFLLRLYQGADRVRWPGAAIVAGVGAAVLLLAALRSAQRRGVLRGASRHLVPLFALLGPGYTREGTDGRVMRDGHPLALGVVVTLSVLFAVGYGALDPSGSPVRIPTIAYVLFLMALVTQTLTGVTFYLDHFRLPTLVGLAVAFTAMGTLFPRDHFFTLTSSGAVEAAGIAEAARARLGQPPPERPLLTVVTASGGGIQAAAWTTQVLTGLQHALGPRFTDSLQLISATSGGSVGAFFFLESFVAEDCDGADPCFETPAQDRLEAIRQAAMASSLDATAWGLVFPDFLRVILPPAVPRLQDRAWAIELAWLQNLACFRAGRDQRTCDLSPPVERATRLADWRRGARAGTLPAVALNAATVEGGRHVVLSSVVFGARPKLQVALEDWLKPDEPEPSLDAIPLDVSAVTAARLSATFPYVTPVARALATNGEQVAAWHVADGGFFDNFGTVAAVQWIDQAMTSLADLDPRVLLIQIDAFAPTPPAAACEEGGWTTSVLGPIKAILAVRSSTQRVRAEVEIDQLQRRFPDALQVVTLRPPAPEPPPASCIGDQEAERREPPLSWELSDLDQYWICEDWTDDATRQVVEEIGEGSFPDIQLADPPPCTRPLPRAGGDRAAGTEPS